MLDGESNLILQYNTLEPHGYNRFLPNTRSGFYTGGIPLPEKVKEKIRNSLLGRKPSEESREKMRKPHKGLSEESREKMRKPKSEETKKLMSLSKKGKKCHKISEIQLGTKRGKYKKHSSNLICPFCFKEVSPNMYARWHGDKCSYKNLDK